VAGFSWNYVTTCLQKRCYRILIIFRPRAPKVARRMQCLQEGIKQTVRRKGTKRFVNTVSTSGYLSVFAHLLEIFAAYTFFVLFSSAFKRYPSSSVYLPYSFLFRVQRHQEIALLDIPAAVKMSNNLLQKKVTIRYQGHAW